MYKTKNGKLIKEEKMDEKKIIELLTKKSELDENHPGVYRGSIVRSESVALPLEFIRKNYKKIAIDWKELQRFFEPWEESKINSYLTTLLYGMEKKDLFQLIELDTQIKWLKSKLDENLSENDREMYDYCLEYFENWETQGYKYLCIDGQHRLYYVHQFLTSKITFDVVGEFAKEWIVNNKPVSMSDTLFENYPSEIKDLINDIEIQSTIYSNAELKTYAMIFSSSNKGRAVHPHEDRMILNNTEWVTYLKNQILDDPNRDDLTKYVAFKAPSIAQKGDTHFVTKMFPWWCSQKPKCLLTIAEKYNFSDKETDFLFETQSIPSGYIKDYSKIWKDVVKCIVNGEPKTKLSLATLANLVYYVSKFTDFGIGDKKFSIEVPDDFLVEFILKEEDRKKRTFYVRDSEGNELLDSEGNKIEDMHGYTRKCKTQTYKNFIMRRKEMDKDIFEDYQTLLNEGIIKELGSRKSNITQYEVAEANNFKDGKGSDITAKDLFSKKGKTFEINEIKPVSDGGQRVVGNTNLLTPKDNKAEYNTKQKYNKA